MRIKKNYLTLLAITLAVIILCFMLPSALFQFYDTEWTEKRVGIRQCLRIKYYSMS